MNDLIDRALNFAAKAHQGQYRKGTDIPYIVHPVGVAMLLQEMDAPAEVLAAGLLHDVVEDTPVTPAQLKAEFGPEIARLVAGASEPDRSATWEARKQHTVEYLRRAPLPVKLIACADKLHNIRTLSRDYAKLGDAVWSRFNRGQAQQAWYYRALAQSLPEGVASPEQYPIFEQFSEAVRRLFGDITNNLK